MHHRRTCVAHRGVGRPGWGVFRCLSLVVSDYVHPGEEGSVRPSLKVNLAAMRAFFERPEFGIIFGEPQERRGVSQITGTVPGKLVPLDLVGPPEALT
jgi:hypothetical protein